MLTEKELLEIEQREEKATAGPWTSEEPYYRCLKEHTHVTNEDPCLHTLVGWEKADTYYPTDIWQKDIPETMEWGSRRVGAITGPDGYEHGGVLNQEDASFIAHAREDIPKLLEEIKRLKKLVKTRPMKQEEELHPVLLKHFC